MNGSVMPLDGASPVLLRNLTGFRIMSKAWAEKNKSLEPKDIKTKEESYAHRNAMGTGPFMVKEWQPDQKLVMVSNPHWWGTAAKAASGNVTEIIYTPIKSEATRMAALLSGQVDFNIDNLATASANIKAGKLKALAVTTAGRSPLLPGVPAMSETIKGFDVGTWWGLVAPAGTPPEVINRLNAAFTEALRTPETQQRFAQLMAEPVPTTPEQFGQFMARERARYEQVVKRSGAKVD